MSFNGMRVLSLESRRSAEMAQLIRNQQGEPFVAPSMREAPLALTTVVRGPKPAAALRELNVPLAVQVPEPNTWREVLAATEGRPERRIAVQEYGKSNPELLNGFRARVAEVTAVRVYQWALPEDTGPLRTAAERLAAGDSHVALLT